MGSRGLGQLAFDKGMRILTASQAGDVSIESNEIRQGLLTNALVRDGLGRGKAAVNGRVTIGGWLKYAERRVPSLFKELLEGNVQGPGDKDGPGAIIRIATDAKKLLGTTV